MDTALTPEQHQFRRALRELLHAHPTGVREAVDTPDGYDRALWSALARQLGLPGLALPESCGGAGGTTADLALTGEETGRVLLPSPLLATTVLAAPALLALGSRLQREKLLPLLADGSLTAALAAPGGVLATALALTRRNDGPWSGGGRAGGVQARREAGTWRLYGGTGQVLDGHSADLLLVPAHTGGYTRSRTLLYLVPGDAPGLTRVRQTALDATRPRARLHLRDVPAELLGEDDAAQVRTALARVGAGAAAFLACEAVGAAARALELTVTHVRHREQFGRPVGSFQALQHRLADVHVAVEAARSAACYAAWASDRAPVAAASAGHHATVPSGPGAAAGPAASGTGCATGSATGTPADATAIAPTMATSAAPTTATSAAPTTTVADADPAAGPLALAQALHALRLAASEAIQFHGGIGFTWEHDAHLYFKRAAGDALLLGPVHRLRAHAADTAGLFTRTEAAR